MYRVDRAGNAGLRDHRKPLGLGFGQDRIRHDNRKRGVLRRRCIRTPFIRIASMSGVNDAGSPRPPYSPSISNGAAQNHGPSPTVTLPTALTTAIAATLMPLCVCADAEPSPPFRLPWSRRGPRRRCRARRCCRRCRRGVAEIPIRREAAPLFVAAVEQIETIAPGTIGIDGFADPITLAPFGEPGLHASAGFQSERRAACQRDPVDLLHRGDGIEQRPLAGAGAAAAHVHRGDRGVVEDHRGDAGAERGIVGVADADAGNISQKVVHGAPRLHPSRTDIAAADASMPSAVRIILASSGLR